MLRALRQLALAGVHINTQTPKHTRERGRIKLLPFLIQSSARNLNTQSSLLSIFRKDRSAFIDLIS